MKKLIVAAAFAAVLVVAGCAGPAQSSGAGASGQSASITAAIDPVTSSSAAQDAQNPVMNFVGPYVCDRANMVVEATGEDGAEISVMWGSGASENSKWTMSGTFDPDTLSVSYTNAARTDYVYNGDGTVKSQKVAYSDGKGRVVFKDGESPSCTWENESEPDNGVMEFVWNA